MRDRLTIIQLKSELTSLLSETTIIIMIIIIIIIIIIVIDISFM